MAYFLYPDIPGASASYSMKWLDGDWSKVSVIDTEPDGGCNLTAHNIMHLLCGRPVQSAFMPTKMKSGFMGKIHPDYCGAAGGALAVSEKFKSIIEAFEPNIHQFFPFDIVSKKNEIRETMYVLIVCNRLDTVNTEKSNRTFKGKSWIKREHDRTDPNRAQWKGKDQLFLDPERIGKAHLWVDKHLSPESPLMSNQLGAALRDAGLTHVGLIEIKES